jgi:tetratricopeptide (TPR) repeat protein
MKLFTGVLFFALLQTAAFARPVASTADNNASSFRDIDKLDDISFNIYLQSPDSARKVAQKALLLSEKLKYPLGIGRSFMNIGFVYWSQSYYPIALFYFNKALENLPADKPLYFSDCYTFMGRTYSDLGNNREAIKNLDRSEDYAGTNVGRLAEVYSTRSYVNMMLKNYSQAIIYAKKALLYNKMAGNSSNTAVVYARLSDIYNRKGDYLPAIGYSDTAYRMAVLTHNNRLRANDYVEYALIYQQLKNFDKSIFYAKKAAALADSIGVVQASADAYSTLISCYEQQNNLKKAMSFQKEYDRTRDSLTRFDETKNAELIQSYFTLNSQLNDIALADHDNQERSKLVRTVLVTMYKLVLIFALNMVALTGVYFFNYHHKAAD